MKLESTTTPLECAIDTTCVPTLRGVNVAAYVPSAFAATFASIADAPVGGVTVIVHV